MNGTIVCGDVHARWGILNQLINKRLPERILACGDFGYWPRERPYRLHRIKNHDTVINWCDGNHEHHEDLAARKSDEVSPNVIYMPRGSTLTLPDGRTVMFFGGADSYDKMQRTEGLDWFREEIPTQAQLDTALAYPGRVDIMISHTAPEEFDVKTEMKLRDPTRVILSRLLEHFRPSLWYFGHWHWYLTGEHNNTHWTCLHYADNHSSMPWWEYLK